MQSPVQLSERAARYCCFCLCSNPSLVSATSRRSFDAEVIGRTGDGGPKFVNRR